jgi:hypothetical protein
MSLDQSVPCMISCFVISADCHSQAVVLVISNCMNSFYYRWYSSRARNIYAYLCKLNLFRLPVCNWRCAQRKESANVA